MGFDEVLAAAETLLPEEQRRLLDLLAHRMKQGRQAGRPRKQRSFFGALRDRGTAPSARDIAETRREVWSEFPRDSPS